MVKSWEAMHACPVYLPASQRYFSGHDSVATSNPCPSVGSCQFHQCTCSSSAPTTPGIAQQVSEHSSDVCIESEISRNLAARELCRMLSARAPVHQDENATERHVGDRKGGRSTTTTGKVRKGLSVISDNANVPQPRLPRSKDATSSSKPRRCASL